MLRCINQENLDRAAADARLSGALPAGARVFDAYLSAPPPRADEPLIAYFCAEYGFHESFPIYSGGLGILAGDHCKAASDERLNFVAVGLLYTQGYFIQSVDNDGVQHANYNETDPRDLPVEAVRDASGQLAAGHACASPAATSCARIWKARVGRVAVYLLDTNCPENAAEDREITHRLYGGDAAMRIRQEMILGLGGVRALRALGLAPAVWHMNEGHAAFLILELVREGIARGLEFRRRAGGGRRAVRVHHAHAGRGRPRCLRYRAVHALLPGLRAASSVCRWSACSTLGRAPHAPHAFNMTHLALQRRAPRERRQPHPRRGVVAAVRRSLARSAAGGQSGRLRHQRRARADLPGADLVRASSIDKLGARVARAPVAIADFWRALEQVPDDEFWQTAQQVKARMLAGVRARLQREYAAKGLSPAQLRHVTRLLDPERPQCADARLRAPLRHLQARLAACCAIARAWRGWCTIPERPVLFLFAGKAHPADQPGQQVLREIKQLMLTPGVRRPRGVPRGLRPAAGALAGHRRRRLAQQSGRAARGQRHLRHQGGRQRPAEPEHSRWLVGRGLRRRTTAGAFRPPTCRTRSGAMRSMRRRCSTRSRRKWCRSTTRATGGGYSPEWVRRCKRAMMTVIPHFNMGRVVQDYARGLYYPAALSITSASMQGGAGGRGGLRRLEAARARALGRRRICAACREPPRELPRGGQLNVRVAAALNGLAPARRARGIRGAACAAAARARSCRRCHRSAASRDDAWRVALLCRPARSTADGSHVYELQAPPPDVRAVRLSKSAFIRGTSCWRIRWNSDC